RGDTRGLKNVAKVFIFPGIRETGDCKPPGETLRYFLSNAIDPNELRIRALLQQHRPTREAAPVFARGLRLIRLVNTEADGRSFHIIEVTGGNEQCPSVVHPGAARKAKAPDPVMLDLVDSTDSQLQFGLMVGSTSLRTKSEQGKIECT